MTAKGIDLGELSIVPAREVEKSDLRGMPKTSPDPRHHTLLGEMDRLYRAANGDLPMPSPRRAARALKDFLDENPKWPLNVLLLCCRNRFASRGVNLAAPPHAWIRTLPQYARGPLDEWGKPLVARGNLEHEIEEYWRRKLKK
jgi:hypothetical protein